MYRDGIRELDEHMVCLDHENESPTDNLFCGTGWNSNSPRFFHQDQIAQLGLPHNESQQTQDDSMWETLEAEADHHD